MGKINAAKKSLRYSNKHNAHTKEIFECWLKGDSSKRIDNLADYIQNYIDKCEEDGEELEICIGTDSAVRQTKQVIVTVICFIKKGHGVHIIRRKETIFNSYKISVSKKLQDEVSRTFDLSLYFKNNNLKNPTVHIDLNPDESYASNITYQSVKGWFEGMGYNCEYKPDSIAAMCAADRFL